MSIESIVVRGARVHNLKNIDFEIPHNTLTVITGVSGSGKSSLAFDTLYAEGQRRYVESLSAYARQFLERIEKPDVDFIDGIAPAIAIKQKNSTRNPRSADSRPRVVDGTEIAYRESGEVIFEIVPHDDSPRRQLRFSQRFECKNCSLRYEEPEPRLFSFNNPFGACQRCQGFGNTIDFDLNLVVPNPLLTLNEGAIEPWTKPKYKAFQAELKRFLKAHDIPSNVPWCDLENDQRSLILQGDGKFPGITGFFALLERKKYKLHVRVFLSRYRGYATCQDCQGQRLRAEARHVRIEGKNICELTAMTVEQAARFVAEVDLRPQQAAIAEKILEEVRDRLGFLNNVGLEYLTLDRTASTLSGGESQRIQLATSLGSRLVGALYVLDEPSIGLHSRDTDRLVRILHELRDLGNTILVVEHDAEVMSAADRILDLGPGAGELGGKVVAAGTYDQILNSTPSLTGRYL